jgi:mRNA interferase MazF
LADLPGNDIIFCQITSQQDKDAFAVSIDSSDFLTGALPMSSNIRPSRIFTADKSIILRKAGSVKPAISDKVSNVLITLIT